VKKKNRRDGEIIKPKKKVDEPRPTNKQPKKKEQKEGKPWTQRHEPRVENSGKKDARKKSGTMVKLVLAVIFRGGKKITGTLLFGFPNVGQGYLTKFTESNK